MVLVRSNVMNPFARKGEVVDVEDSEKVRTLVDRGVMEYVENHVAPVSDEADHGVDESDESDDEVIDHGSDE